MQMRHTAWCNQTACDQNAHM